MLEGKWRLLTMAMACVTAVGCGLEPGEADEDADEEEVEQTSDEIVGGRVDYGHPAVGNLRFDVTSSGGSGTGNCTATLVAPKVLLTAAHCVTPTAGMKLSNFRVSFATRPDSGKWFRAVATVAHPRYSPKVFGSYDVAVVVLAGAPGIRPMPVARSFGNVVGQRLTHVGAGTTFSAGPDMKYGAGTIKKKITLPISGQNAELLRTGQGTGGICNGDSGGPALLRIDGVEAVAGVHSFIDDNNYCLGNGYSTRVDRVRDFIARYL